MERWIDCNRNGRKMVLYDVLHRDVLSGRRSEEQDLLVSVSPTNLHEIFQSHVNYGKSYDIFLYTF